MNIYEEHLKSDICVLNMLQFKFVRVWNFQTSFNFPFSWIRIFVLTKIELFCKISNQNTTMTMILIIVNIFIRCAKEYFWCLYTDSDI